AFDPSRRQPVARARTRAGSDLEASVRAADDFLAGESLPLHRVRNQAPFRLVESHGPEARLRRSAGEHGIATAVERAPAIVVARKEGNTVAGADRQLAAAGDHGTGIRVDTGRAVSRPRGPRPDGHPAIGGTFGERYPGRAKTDRSRY